MPDTFPDTFPGTSAASPQTLDEIVVASVPANHVYVRHISAESDDGVRRLRDPAPDSPARSAEQRWWPPVMLDPAWVESHDFDVFHVQFGFDAWDPRDLAAVVDAVHRTGRRFVYTAHDLRNPHHATRHLHDAQLDVLIREADAVITLTQGAADEIEARWGRRPLVLAHPHVVELGDAAERAATARRTDHPFRVGLHLKSLRASMAPATILPTLVGAVAEIPGAVLQVNGHNDVLRKGGRRFDAELAAFLRDAETEGRLELHVHDFMSDSELWDYLASLDASVLPYRFGTHSGWLEACRDLGTAVLAPTCGYYADQGPVHSYVLDESQWRPETLRAAVRDAYEAGRPEPVPVSWRRQQRADLAAAHREIYRATP